MGKIRVKTLGEDEQEKVQKKRDEERRAIKRAKKGQEEKKEVKAAQPEKKTGKKEIAEKKPQKEDTLATEKPKVKKTKQAEGAKVPPNRRPHVRSKRYTKIYSSVDRAKRYPISDAIKLVKDTSNVKFNGTIEAHFNLTKKPKELNLKKDKALPVSYEKKFPLAHAKIGSVKDADGDIEKQLDAMIKKIGVKNITKLTLSSTMGPGVKVEL